MRLLTGVWAALLGIVAILVTIAAENTPIAPDGHCTDGENCTETSSVHVITLEPDTRKDMQNTDGRDGYAGETDAEGKPHGIGVFKDAGTIYTGQFEHGMFHGEGTVQWPTNGTYTGAFLHGVPHGRGRHTGSDGETYWGLWADGTRHGLGIVTLPDGSTVFGEWDHGESLGRGVNVRPDRLIDVEINVDSIGSDADTTAGKRRRGQGFCTFANGDMYVGQWLAVESASSHAGGAPPPPAAQKQPDVNPGTCTWEHSQIAGSGGFSVSFYGAGFYKFSNGDYYAGDFKNMAREGTGTYVGVDGGRYAGGWKAGRYHGLGTLVLPGGQGVQAGRWDNNIYNSDGNNLPQLAPGI